MNNVTQFWHQKIQIQIAFQYIVSNSFDFFESLKVFLNKHGYNFDDVSKNKDINDKRYKGILKERHFEIKNMTS